MNFVPKQWGYEIWYVNNEKYCGKKLFIRQGKYCSFHLHRIKEETLLVEGRILMAYGYDLEAITTVELNTGQAFHIKPGLVHQMYAVEDTFITEFSTQHFDEDSYRLTTNLVADVSLLS
jgi:quercetin dioxygenase-like cupin family protein